LFYTTSSPTPDEVGSLIRRWGVAALAPAIASPAFSCSPGQRRVLRFRRGQRMPGRSSPFGGGWCRLLNPSGRRGRRGPAEQHPGWPDGVHCTRSLVPADFYRDVHGGQSAPAVRALPLAVRETCGMRLAASSLANASVSRPSVHYSFMISSSGRTGLVGVACVAHIDARSGKGIAQFM